MLCLHTPTRYPQDSKSSSGKCGRAMGPSSEEGKGLVAAADETPLPHQHDS